MWSGRLFRTIASLAFYLRALELINRFVNRFRPNRSANGRLAFPFVRKTRAANFQILVYHRVNDEHDPFFPAVPTEVFRKRMEYLASHFTVCPLQNGVDMLRRGDLPDNALALTFDDGYRDNYLNAFPILKQLGLPATIFLPTAAISYGITLWHDRVFWAFRETEVTVVGNFGGKNETYFMPSPREKLSVLQHVLSVLRAMNVIERETSIGRLLTKLGVPARNGIGDLMLSWDEIRIMHQNGITFGSHSCTHPILSKLSTEDVRSEVLESKDIIEKEVGTQVTAFAYPSGRAEDFDARTKGILKEEGYSCALTTIFGANQKAQDPFELRRGGPWEAHLPTFALKLNWYKFND